MKELLGMIAIAVTIMVAGILGLWGLGFLGEAGQVMHEQFGPRALLQKYEWFKDASAQLDKKQADITVYEERLRSLENAYKGISRSAWARDDREQYSVWSSEVAGVRASFNSLAAEYNSGMAKFNFRFANVGELPAGATTPLPREYKPYEREGR